MRRRHRRVQPAYRPTLPFTTVPTPLDVALDLLVARVPGVAAVYLYGSEAQGTATAESDLDLAVLADRPLGAVARFDLAQQLAACAGRDVDLVDLRATPTVMQMQVLNTGRVVRDLDPAARRAFEVFVLASYALHNEERAGIVEDIQARGRVYGR